MPHDDCRMGKIVFSKYTVSGSQGIPPGGDEKLLANESEIRLTQSAMVLEQLIGQFLFSKSDDKSKSE